mmetsp:Transcript_32143/g.44874  ORF Transcript_32143/g.44874 Transcript_32143/m.44874 type:complete len:389 (+) Transcript_32143:188-1354(+)
MHHSRECQHCQTAVAKLLHGQLISFSLVLWQESFAEIQVPGSSLCTLTLKHVKHGQLPVICGALNVSGSNQQHCSHVDRGSVNGLQSVRRGGKARELKVLLGHEANSCQHANSSMLQLSLSKPFDVKGVGEAQRIELRIATHQTAEVGRLRQERHGLAAAGMTCHCCSATSESGTTERAARMLFWHCVDHGIKERPLLLGQDCNSHNAGVGQHCEAAIAQLLDLHIILALGIGRIEASQSKVTWFAISLALLHVDDGQESKQLQVSEPHQDLWHASELHHGIMGFQSGDLEHIAGNAKTHISRDPTQCGQHGHSAVLQLSLAKPTDVDGQGESHRVETFLFTWDALQSWRHGQEWNCCTHLVTLVSLSGHVGPCLLHTSCEGAASAGD